jgi:AAA domain
MPVEIVSMENESPTGNIRLALVGEEKSGKSRCAATGRKPVLFLDFDRRREAIAGIPGVYAITFHDAVYPKMPDAAALAMDLMTKLETSLDLSKLQLVAPDGTVSRVTPPPPEGTILQTLVFDSMSTMANAFRNYAMANNKDLRREISIGATKSYFVKGWDTWNAETSQIEPFFLRSLALGIDVICIFHEKKEEAEDSTEDSPKFTGRVTVFPARYRSLIKYFSEVWRMKLENCQIQDNGKLVYKYVPRVKPWPSFEFSAATAMLLDETENPDIEAMIKKSEARRSSSNKSLSEGVPKQLK